MVWLILAMVVCVVLAGAVVGLVAVPARREGREVFTERGDDVIAGVARRTDKVVSGAKGATGSVVEAAKNRTPSVPNRTETSEASE
ncbi:hypothetical protein [Luteipulveratus mongoliensis]|uniref:Uncharacterized protein n=1 Tax=Luteipulveratus mongoliensis TaxID=571913 RepID=A0A0K1JI28_9MICO|nr:hypothetical protein [Luteipulveratus mongoliensis]AKU16374.1 hypothetical protein VV02_11710 [Luteipulveratus mongoliensis]